MFYAHNLINVKQANYLQKSRTIFLAQSTKIADNFEYNMLIHITIAHKNVIQTQFLSVKESDWRFVKEIVKIPGY